MTTDRLRLSRRQRREAAPTTMSTTMPAIRWIQAEEMMARAAATPVPAPALTEPAEVIATVVLTRVLPEAAVPPEQPKPEIPARFTCTVV